MLTKLTIRNFKSLRSAEIELGNPVVFIGPNDSGKTSALQALALWDLGRRRWMEKRGGPAPVDDLPKSSYHRLVQLLDPEDVHADVIEVLDAITMQHRQARPAE